MNYSLPELYSFISAFKTIILPLCSMLAAFNKFRYIIFGYCSILKEINTEYSLEGLMLKLKLQ